ncbi:MAG: hypothetical protein WBW88_17950 [Rhodothermales bacterium]
MSKNKRLRQMHVTNTAFFEPVQIGATDANGRNTKKDLATSRGRSLFFAQPEVVPLV